MVKFDLPEFDFERPNRLKKSRALTVITSFLACLVILAPNTFMNYSSEPSRVLSKYEDEEYQQNILRFLYYNVDPKDKTAKVPLPTENYPIGEGSVIALLVSARPKDLEEAQTALKSLQFLKGDKNPDHPAPVLIFNEGLMKEDELTLASSTNRPISFPRIDFTSFPEGFNPDQETIHFRVPGRNPWGYYQMIRFWTTIIWKQAAIERYENVMRIDSDSCFKEVNDYLPNFMHDGLYYHSQYVGVEPIHGANYIEGMYEFVQNWMKETQQPSEPRNSLLWHYASMVWESQRTLPLFRTNFELSKRSFMQRGDVARFHEALTEKSPFPVLRMRWGDAVLRFLMVAVFESPSQVLTTRPEGYFHKIGCSREEVEEALRSLNE